MITAILMAASLATAPSPGFCSIGFVRDDGKPEEVHPESARVWLEESIPMPVDFVRDMPVIVRARAIREVPRQPGDDAGRGAPPTSVQFLVTEILRGGRLPDTLQFGGYIDERDHFTHRPVPYRRGRESLDGSCHARNYKTGAEYLLFLGNTEFGLHLYHSLFSPVNEQLRGPDDPWLLWVREQVAADTVPHAFVGNGVRSTRRHRQPRSATDGVLKLRVPMSYPVVQGSLTSAAQLFGRPRWPIR